MNQTTLQQKLLAFDISALSLPDELPQWKKPPTPEQALLLNELLAQKYDPNTPIGKAQVFQHLDRKARKDYGGIGKQAEYEISADRISQKLDKHQQKSLNALQAELSLEWFRAVMVHASKRVPDKEKHAFGNARYRYLYNLFIFQDFLQK